MEQVLIQNEEKNTRPDMEELKASPPIGPETFAPSIAAKTPDELCTDADHVSDSVEAPNTAVPEQKSHNPEVTPPPAQRYLQRVCNPPPQRLHEQYMWLIL